jgi:osmotically-inducible protein OsmY
MVCCRNLHADARLRVHRVIAERRRITGSAKARFIQQRLWRARREAGETYASRGPRLITKNQQSDRSGQIAVGAGPPSEVTTQGGKVTLQGAAQSEAERTSIFTKAADVAGGTNVVNNITVSAPH